MFKFINLMSLLTLPLLVPVTANAQMKFIDAAQIKPILTATKGNWVAVREYGGSDLLYFTHLLAWRCGLSGISYTLNDENTLTEWDMGRCDEDLPNPNVFGEDQKIYTTQPLGSIKSITVHITYDDDTTDEMRFERKDVQMP